MKLNLLVATSQLKSNTGNMLGTGTSEGLDRLAEIMSAGGICGDIYDLPNGAQSPATASPFSLTSGFALKTDELAVGGIPELLENVKLNRHVTRIAETHQRHFGDKRRVNYGLKRSLMPWILEECYGAFKKRQYEHRLEQFNSFQAAADFWLDDYALFEAYKFRELDLSNPAYRRKTSPEVIAFSRAAAELIEFFKYQQFICFEQKQAIRRNINRRGIGLFVNLPFGVELESADVFFHPEVFDDQRQVGCSPEPEHGYPEQAWGIAVYRERSQGLADYLTARMQWLALLGDGVFLDHMVGWCGQYVLPMKIPAGSVYPHGEFLTTDHEERKTNMRWFLEIVLQTGLKIRGEIAGDHKRVLATIETVEAFAAAGHEIGTMAVPRWESENGRLKPLHRYRPSTLTMVETHDTSTLLQYLLNQKGYDADFESPILILEFCRRVLGLPFFAKDVPLTLDGCADIFWLEVCRRFAHGSPSTELVFTLPGLLSILTPRYRSASIENNINIKPGTSGAVGNGWGNWSYFSPPIEIIRDDPVTRSRLKELGNRSYTPFDYFHELDGSRISHPELAVIHSNPCARRIVCRNDQGRWDVLERAQLPAAAAVELELLVANESEVELWERIDVSGLLDLEPPSGYSFTDLNGKMATYRYAAADLKTDRLFSRLAPGQVHHFLVTRQI